MGLSKDPDINQMVFPAVIFFPLVLSFPQALASHPHQAIHIVISLWDVCLQPQALHLFFLKILYLQNCDFPWLYEKQHVRYVRQGIRKTRCKTSKVGSISHRPFLTPKVVVFIIVLVHVPHSANYLIVFSSEN